MWKDGAEGQKGSKGRHLRLAGAFINEMSRCVGMARTVNRTMCVREEIKK